MERGGVAVWGAERVALAMSVGAETSVGVACAGTLGAGLTGCAVGVVETGRRLLSQAASRRTAKIAITFDSFIGLTVSTFTQRY